MFFYRGAGGGFPYGADAAEYPPFPWDYADFAGPSGPPVPEGPSYPSEAVKLLAVIEWITYPAPEGTSFGSEAAESGIEDAARSPSRCCSTTRKVILAG